MTKIISKFLAIIMIINIISVNYIELAFSEDEKSTSIDISTYKDGNIKKILKGQKGVEYNIDSLHIDHGKSYKLNKAVSNLSDHIKIVVNGETQDYINTDNNKLKFDFTYDEKKGSIKIGIKEGQSNNTHMKPFILRKHSLYNVIITPGIFIEENGTKNEEINYTFTTKGDGLYGNDIIKDISPDNLSTSIDYENGRIIIDFIDEIYLKEDVYANKQNYFEISSSPITNPDVPNYENPVVQDINNFAIEPPFSNNQTVKRLILKSKNGRLNDFANYKLTLKAGAVQLRDSKIGTEISNDTQSIVFATNNWVDSLNLSTGAWIPYQLPLGNIEDVPINPLIQVKFKYPVELINKSKIKLSSDAGDFSIDLKEDSRINYDGNTLKLDINSMTRGGENPLRKNTAYKITLEKGALRLKGYSNSQSNSQVENEEMNIYFITGDWKTSALTDLYPIGYSSGDPIKDDISKKNSTFLDKNDAIYIHFNRKIQWNKWDTTVSTDADALPHFKLYKKPSAYERDYNEKGVIFDKQYRYTRDQNSIRQKIYTKNGIEEDEIPIEYVKLSNNVIKIKPKYELINLNEYRIVLDKKEIITDFNEKKLINNINQEIWTKGNGDLTVPDWIPPYDETGDITAEEIIENTHSPYKSYKIYGVPEYNEFIDKENGKPIIIYIDNEVIPNPRRDEPLLKISLLEGYGNGNPEQIKWYKIEYIKTGNSTKTKISLYPSGTLDSGKFYKLKIPNQTFVTRNGLYPEYGAELEFVVRGDKKDSKGINRVNMINGPSAPLLIGHFTNTSNPLKLNIKGYNFNEDIKGIRFIRERDGKKIELESQYIKFKNVTELEATISGNAAKELSETKSGGVYKIEIDFKDGVSAKGDYLPNTTLIVKERPVLLRTEPGETFGSRYIDEKSIYRTGGADKTYYITLIFADIDKKLDLNKGKKEYEGIEVKVEGGLSNMVDTQKDMLTSRVNSEFIVRIPIEGEFEENKKYQVTIPEDLVDFTDISLGTGGNEGRKWTFLTSVTPSTNTGFKGSVPEDYDEKYPIILQGNNFKYDSDVYFVDINNKKTYAYDVDVEINTSGDIAKVYLPRGRSKLKVGLYDIFIKNDSNHGGFYKYGVFSVVAKGEFVPNEEYVQKSSDTKGEDIRVGDLKKYTKTSADTLELSSRYTDYRDLELDLDEIMGEGVWSRNIAYRGYANDTLNRLITKSKWVDATLTNVTLESYSNDRDVLIRIGRAPVTIEDSIKKKIAGRSIKSDFIEVGGSNYKVSKLNLSIPFRESDGKGLILLRYDQQTRGIIEVSIGAKNINSIEKKAEVELLNLTKGIFVIVE